MLALSELTVRAINIAVLSFCSFELMILLLSFPRFKLKKRASSIFYAKMLVSVFVTVCYIGSLIYGPDRSYAISMILHVLIYAGIYLLYFMYIMYIKEYINSIEKASDKKVPEWIMYVSAAVGIAGALVRIIFTSAPVPLRYLGGWILIIISLILLLSHRKSLGNREMRILLSMPALLAIATLCEPYAQGIELRYPCIMLEILIIYTHHHQEHEVEREITETEELRRHLRLTADRMNPHYLYNVLTTIYYLCDTDPARAQHAIGTFSEYMRSTLEAMEEDDLVEFVWELHEIQNYLILEKIRFGDKLNVIYDIEFDDFLMPPLTVQPFVENAVRHGIGNRAEGGTIRISTRKLYDGNAHIKIQDDGVGFDVESIAGQDYMREGIANVKERLRIEVGGDVSISSTPDKGTTVSITIRQAKKNTR